MKYQHFWMKEDTSYTTEENTPISSLGGYVIHLFMGITISILVDKFHFFYHNYFVLRKYE